MSGLVAPSRMRATPARMRRSSVQCECSDFPCATLRSGIYDSPTSERDSCPSLLRFCAPPPVGVPPVGEVCLVARRAIPGILACSEVSLRSGVSSGRRPPRPRAGLSGEGARATLRRRSSHAHAPIGGR